MILIPLIFLKIENDSDRDFMQTLYMQHYRLMYHIARQEMGNSIGLDDVVGDVCIILMRKIDTLRQLNENLTRSYIAVCTKRAVAHYLRSEKRQDTNPVMIHLQAEEDADDIPTTARLEFEESVHAMMRGIEMLDERDRDILFMKYFEHLSDGEMADALGIKPDSVRSSLTRARRRALRKMKELMKDEDR